MGCVQVQEKKASMRSPTGTTASTGGLASIAPRLDMMLHQKAYRFTAHLLGWVALGTGNFTLKKLFIFAAATFEEDWLLDHQGRLQPTHQNFLPVAPAEMTQYAPQPTTSGGHPDVVQSSKRSRSGDHGSVKEFQAGRNQN
jgi:hypothetical protein